jgi:predicted ABC-type ATPase
MSRTLYIIGGLPGSGKSTLARKLADVVFSEDDYWTEPDGSYHFSPTTRYAAFAAMERNAIKAIDVGVERIALATAALSFETEPISSVFNHASSRGYNIQFIFLPRITSGKPSIHGLSESEMDRFRREMQHGLEVDI